MYFNVFFFCRVTAISNTKVKLFFNEEDQLIIQEMTESDIQEFNLISQGIAKTLVIFLYKVRI